MFMIKIVQIAGFRPQKDQDTVIRSLALLPENYEVYFVGDGERKKECELLATSLNLSSRIHFLGVCNNISQILSEMDVLVMSSHWEGFGLAAVEGMAAGKPVIASDVDGLREVVKGYGVLFPAGDAHALAKEISYIGENRELYQSVAKRCSQRARDFDISKMIDGYYKIYASLDEDC